jgi:hypothetical protein
MQEKEVKYDAVVHVLALAGLLGGPAKPCLGLWLNPSHNPTIHLHSSISLYFCLQCLCSYNSMSLGELDTTQQADAKECPSLAFNASKGQCFHP